VIRILAGRVLAALAIAAVPIMAAAQTAPGTQGGTPAAYRPSLGDLMTTTVQPRHIKLALAGKEKNWPYAEYERHELEEAFEHAAHIWPQWRSTPIGEMMSALTEAPMAALSQAIKAENAAQFTAAYGKLTETCNACHQAANRGMIVIKVPDSSPFADQDFRPVKP
jgi:hypothetical protein